MSCLVKDMKGISNYIMEKRMVRCNKADECPTPCATHGFAHERECVSGVYCTSLGLCDIGEVIIKVRCITAKRQKYGGDK